VGSILIPAYNEQAVIGRTLQGVLTSVGPADHEIIVVCNACRDATASIAREFSPRVQVIETDKPGKCHAINLGERHLTSFPRIYLDADIEVSPTLVPDMMSALDTDEPRAAWSDVRYDLEHSSWPVRAFYRVWTALPYNQPGRIGVGVYAANAAGRSRFGAFPDIISDDGFVRGHFPQDQERLIVRSCQTRVRAPHDLQSLINVRTRSRMGVYELGEKYPSLLAGHRTVKDSRVLRLPPSRWIDLPLYISIVWLTKRRARQRWANQAMHWDRDASARGDYDPLAVPSKP
jgi:glycosyltransferase involved in cell wall biosynthesis